MEEALKRQRQFEEDHDLALAIERSEIDEEAEAERRILDRICETQVHHDRILRRTSSMVPRQTCMPSTTKAVPAQSVASQDHERLFERLSFYGMEEVVVKGDGNCQFRALSEQLYRTEELHAEVRGRAVEQLKRHPELYAPYVEVGDGAGPSGRPLPKDFEAYRLKMAKDGEWGDHVTLQAVADCFGVEIFVVTSYMFNGILETKPHGGARSERALWVSFWAEVHYNSIYPAGEVPSPHVVVGQGGAAGRGVVRTASIRKFTDDVFFGRL